MSVHPLPFQNNFGLVTLSRNLIANMERLVNIKGSSKPMQHSVQ